MKTDTILGVVAGLALTLTASGREIHVAKDGDDAHDGSATRRLKTVSAAAAMAQPGDVVTVHAGVYREEVNPPRGGESDAKRITYRAAPGEHVAIKGSEVVKGWAKVGNDTWKVTLPNTFFGEFNPYADEINGDWFNPKGRKHHTGAVYRDGHWLIEAANREDVLKPHGEASGAYMRSGKDQVLLNVAWFQVGEGTRIPADKFAAQEGVKTAPCTEGGQCIGWLEHGDWVRYEGVDFGMGADSVAFRVASASRGGLIEVRLGASDGELLGEVLVPGTGGWQAWMTGGTRMRTLKGVQTLCLVFTDPERAKLGEDPGLWFAEVDDKSTTIWAQFKGVNPNEKGVEINVRQAVFYPRETGRNYITVRGFTLEHAATNWAPPTAEQVGLIGTHWSKGWIIEGNTIRYSVCTGLTLGKHGDRFDNTSANSAEGYVKTIERGLAAGWSKENIGHHIVRNNEIAHCEQAGIVGSLGPVFCTVTRNLIHDIHVRQLFTGAEMAGIKFHAAIDTVISDNHIHRAGRGIWLDWMTQGTHVTRNLVHDISPREDLFVEVNHGPFLVDHNIFLSDISLLDVSEGGAYAHNLFAGKIINHPELRRETPWQVEHGTEMAGLAVTKGGDNRFYNNVFVGPAGLDGYDKSALPNRMAGNFFLKGAKPSKQEKNPVVLADLDPGIHLAEKKDGWYFRRANSWIRLGEHPAVTSELLGKAAVTGQAYLKPDGSAYRFDTDFVGTRRFDDGLIPGPFSRLEAGKKSVKVWPPANPK